MAKTIFKYKNRDVSSTLTRKVRKKGEILSPAFWRVTYNRKHKHYSSGFEFTISDWDDFVNRNLQKHKDIKSTLEKYKDETLKPIIDSLVEKNEFSFEALNKKLGKSDIVTVNDAFKAKIDDLMEDNKIGNSEIYQTSYNALQRFKHYKSLKGKTKDDFLEKCIELKNVTKGENKIAVDEKQIVFQDLTPQFLKECDKFWRNTGVSTSTIAMRMRTIRSIVKNVNKPFLSVEQYPFGKGKYLIPSSTRSEDFYPIEDVWQLEEYETDYPAMDMARAVFTFMFYGSGINFKDLCLLKYNHITYNGELKFYREKTDTDSGNDPQSVYVPILPPMIEIINRYGNKDQAGYIFPFLNGVDENDEAEIKRRNRRDLEPINSNLKIIAAELGLNTEISTNWARHSYMTHLLSEEMLNETVAKQMVGHSTKKDVTAGYNHLTPKKRLEINSRLLSPNKKYNTINKVAKNW